VGGHRRDMKRRRREELNRGERAEGLQMRGGTEGGDKKWRREESKGRGQEDRACFNVQ